MVRCEIVLAVKEDACCFVASQSMLHCVTASLLLIFNVRQTARRALGPASRRPSVVGSKNIRVRVLEIQHFKRFRFSVVTRLLAS
jgi:hypothetical protein